MTEHLGPLIFADPKWIHSAEAVGPEGCWYLGLEEMQVATPWPSPCLEGMFSEVITSFVCGIKIFFISHQALFQRTQYVITSAGAINDNLLVALLDLKLSGMIPQPVSACLEWRRGLLEMNEKQDLSVAWPSALLAQTEKDTIGPLRLPPTQTHTHTHKCSMFLNKIIC